MKKKILFIAPNLHHGGAESVLVKIINNIDLVKFDVQLVLLKKEGDHLSKLNKEIDVIDLNSSSAIRSAIQLKKTIDLERPDYVFSIIGHLNLILAALKVFFFKKITFIGRENIVYSEWLFKEKSFKKILLTLGYRVLLKRLNTVVVQSEFMAQQIKKYFKVPSNNIFVLNNPIEHSKIKIMMEEQHLNEFWDNNKVNLIAIGRIEPVKNYAAMVEILQQLPQKFHLNILGDGKARSDLQRYINNKNMSERITIHGFVENPYKYLKNSYALMLTSTRESFPNVAIEANSCGVYVGSFNMPGGISEIIINDFNGFLVEENAKKEFADKLIELREKGYDSEAIVEHSFKYSIQEYMKKFYKLIE